MSRPQTYVCAGGGGVGKTTASAALALTLARRGERVLVVSIDPARRLADALGVKLGGHATAVQMDAGDGALFAMMPDPRDSMQTFINILFENEPEALERMLKNRLYQMLENAVPGMHELVAMTLTWRAVDEHEVSALVIDTAPSRNAVDFISYPDRLAKLLGGRAVTWLSALARSDGEQRPKGRAGKLLDRVLGPAVGDLAGFFGELARVRGRFVELNEGMAELLLGSRSSYLVVAAPTGAARDDAAYLIRRLEKLIGRPAALIVNAAMAPERAWAQTLSGASETTAAMGRAIELLEREAERRARASQKVVESLQRRHANIPLWRLPFVEALSPREVVEQLSTALSSLVPA
ncbi:MAG: AAA family ATPase [Deltaproteobacteria bacterium]|nr:AAA family ATPase [Deltaproteobacteria bacterium]